MGNVYNQYLVKALEFNYLKEKYEQLEEIMATAERAGLPLGNPLEITDRIEFALSLTSAAALFKSYQVNGNDGYIVYLDHGDQLVAHSVNGRIRIIEKRL